MFPLNEITMSIIFGAASFFCLFSIMLLTLSKLKTRKRFRAVENLVHKIKEQQEARKQELSDLVLRSGIKQDQVSAFVDDCIDKENNFYIGLTDLYTEAGNAGIESLDMYVSALLAPYSKLSSSMGEAAMEATVTASATGEASEKVEELTKDLENKNKEYQELEQRFDKSVEMLNMTFKEYAATTGIVTEKEGNLTLDEILKFLGKETLESEDVSIEETTEAEEESVADEDVTIDEVDDATTEETAEVEEELADDVAIDEADEKIETSAEEELKIDDDLKLNLANDDEKDKK